MSHKTWMYTLNNYTDSECEILQELEGVSRHCCGKELAPTTGTPHLQGRITFRRAKRLAGVKKILKRAHWESAIFKESDYELKDNTFIDIDNGAQGHRTDIQLATAMLASSCLQEVARVHPTAFVKYHKGLLALKMISIVPRNEKPEVIVLFGRTGTGKSRLARELVSSSGGDPYIWHPQNGMWFDGYYGQKNIIFEEFRGQLPWGMLLSLTDRYDCKVQYKGGICDFVGTKIIFTSPRHPQTWYRCIDEDDYTQFDRRITEINCLDEDV